MSDHERVVILGASDRPDRFAHKAMQALLRHGHEVVLVHPRHKEIEGRPVLADVGEVTGAVDTVTMYVGPAISAGLADKLGALKPRRVIFNPGSENPELQEKLANAGIRSEEGCTLVMLATGQY